MHHNQTVQLFGFTSQRLVAEFMPTEKNDTQLIKLQRTVAELSLTTFSSENKDFPLPFTFVPWGQHIEIITRCKNLEEAVFYIQQVITKGLSRPSLINCIKSNLYDHQGKIVNNFTDHLPTLQSRLVQEVLKENYDFGFAGCT